MEATVDTSAPAPHPWGMLRILFLLMFLPLCAFAADGPGRICSEGRFGPQHCIRDAHYTYDVCQQIEAEATLHGLSPHFFARLLWQESRFDRFALSHANARGIAQFIDSTAKLRGLRDSYNPAEAMEKSAEYLGDMQRRFGSAGAAAIGYNGGERRITNFLAGTGGLARETVDYVRIITGLRAEDWRDAPDATPDMRLSQTLPFQPACREMARNRRVTALQLTPAKPKAKPAGVAPWGVQVAYGTSRKGAKSAVQRLPRACRAGKIDYIRQKQRGSRPDLILARIGHPSRRAASNACNKIRRAGCVCAVYPN